MSAVECQRFLDAHGLIMTVLPVATQASATEASDAAPQHEPAMVVLANAGPRFWRHLRRTHPGDIEQQSHPVDEHAIAIASEFVDTFLQRVHAQRLYPDGDDCPSLIELGRRAGWTTPSPLGLGLHPQHGPWLAYRAVLRLAACPAWLAPWKLAAPPGASQAHHNAPCLQCAAPCASACPGKAVSLHRAFDVDACLTHRSKPLSVCADWCAARVACPVGSESRYDDEQLRYHMQRSMAGLRAWLASSDSH